MTTPRPSPTTEPSDPASSEPDTDRRLSSAFVVRRGCIVELAVTRGHLHLQQATGGLG